MFQEIEIDILPNGNIRLKRWQCGSNKVDSNKDLFLIVQPLCNGKEAQQLQEFLTSAEKIEVVQGDEPLCG